jgi:response regulator RpfG family c-di-GMP phosphodiesterase
VILADQRMPDMSGVQLLEWVRERSPKTIRLLMTAFADLEETQVLPSASFDPWAGPSQLQMPLAPARDLQIRLRPKRHRLDKCVVCGGDLN